MEYAKHRFLLKNNVRYQYRQIKHALPQHWKETIKQFAENLSNLYMQTYKPRCQSYHEKDFDNYDFNWKLIYGISRIATLETKIRIFQYKLHNNVLHLNKKLFKFGIISQSKCSFCEFMMKHRIIFFMNARIHKIYGTNFDYIFQKKLHYQS